MKFQKGSKDWDLIAEYTLRLLREVTGLTADRLRASTPFDEIGLESLAITAFTARLEHVYTEISKTFLFDCKNIEDVCFYLLKHYPAQSDKLAESIRPERIDEEEVGNGGSEDWPELVSLNENTNYLADELEDGFAIIGMQGRFPGADTLTDLWDLLQRGIDAVDEIPVDRWSLNGFYEQGTASRQTRRSYSKWGGFIDGVDKFDAQFFGISPRESILMDPQERLFLECAWHTMEHAALQGERSQTLLHEGRRDVGVFVGVTTNTYQLLGPDHWRLGGSEIPGAMPWSVANRVSYALNLCGPSLAIDTACSSSLVALHLACESLSKGECSAALVGGVNLYLHPAKYIQLCQHQMLSPSGRCHSFGVDADGFVPGEGVGAIVVKPLGMARRDDDRILAVIRGSAVNHSGRTNGYTVPNAQSQTQLVKRALKNARIPPSSIGYVEAHGTGTKLGDPIELSGLAEALVGSDIDHPCGVGSVKSNIGHLESAAGIASVIKVVLQLQHRQIAPSLHSDELNPALGLDGLRFFVPQVLTPWVPELGSNRLRAGISSFGAGGTNAHVIVEDALDDVKSVKISGPLAFPLSARTKEQLNDLVERLRSFIKEDSFDLAGTIDLSRLAYTLQCGRQHLEYRFIAIAGHPDELAILLTDFLEKEEGGGSTQSSLIYTGHVRIDEETESDDLDVSLTNLAKHWTNGLKVIWSKLWPLTPQPCDAPLYPFARDRYWIPSVIDTSVTKGILEKENSLTDGTWEFSFRGDEFFLRDHRILGKPILPATVYLDRCKGIAEKYGLGSSLELRNFSWIAPLRLTEQGNHSMICTVQQHNDSLDFEFSSPDRVETYCRGHCCTLPLGGISITDTLGDIRLRCTQTFDAKKCYPIFESLGMNYGASFRLMEMALLGENEALVEVCLHSAGRESFKPTGLDPALLDGVLQSAFLFDAILQPESHSPIVPFSVKSIRVYSELNKQVFVHVRRKSGHSRSTEVFDFTVFSPEGKKVIEIEKFNFRYLTPLSSKEIDLLSNEEQTQLFEPFWSKNPLVGSDDIDITQDTYVLFDNTPDLFTTMCMQVPELNSVLWLVLAGNKFEIKDKNIIEWDPAQPKHLELVWRMFNAKGVLPKQVIFNLACEVPAENMLDSWERLVNLDRVKYTIDILRSLCSASAVPRFHTQIILGSDYDEDMDFGSGIAFSGFLRAVHQEIPTITATILKIDQEMSNQDLATVMMQEVMSDTLTGVSEIAWKNDCRWVRSLRLTNLSALSIVATPPVNDGEVIVITGGAGAIGRRVSEELAQISGIGVNIALLGRSTATESIRGFIDSLVSSGAKAEYWQVDCADYNAMDNVLTEVRTQFGSITGVLHCAGVLQDAFFMRQSDTDWKDVIQPKVLGAHWLDKLTRDDPLRWFVLCSALAGVFGNVGQSYYGLANSWLDRFAEKRQVEVNRGLRNGSTTAIAWPLWKTSFGMQAPPYMLDSLTRKGLTVLPEKEGATIFLSALNNPQAVLIPVKGKLLDVKQFINSEYQFIYSFDNVVQSTNQVDSEVLSSDIGNTVTQGISSKYSDHEIEESIISYLSEHLAVVTGTPLAKINEDESLETFGLDSILVMELNTLLEEQFPQMSKTALFEVRSLRSLAQLLIAEHLMEAEKVAEKSKVLSKENTQVVSDTKVTSVVSEMKGKPNKTEFDNSAIAIIGLAGSYPGASTYEELWEHLAKGHDLVTEIPERWPLEIDKGVYARWGGFLENHDAFDPLFFGISPRDAERMDPQERIFLQTAWHTLENAGYTPETLSGKRNSTTKRKRVGVIVGVMYGEYQYFSAASGSKGLANSSYASIANRVSFCLDLDGPSFAVDSMCSSSLTSIHLASDLLRSGDCDTVLAGGVNLSLHPYKYRMLCGLKFASTDGKCRSFGDGGDGYVPGEGVGAVLLKRLDNAIQDHDHIHAVIRGSDLGHGARTSGYTVPNVDAQADVINRAFKQAKVPISRLSYVEAHGTGTSLGDPIEIRSLNKALAHNFEPEQRCPIGSVKSNIGHLEAAAGIAAVTKVILQIKHRKLVPSIHSTILNKNIDFSKIPFFVQSQLTDWVETSGLPRLASVSSFGAGGANAHLVIEEFISAQKPTVSTNQPMVFVFSARSHLQLETWLRRFVVYLKREMNVLENEELLGQNGYTTYDVAMTLRTGRRAFQSRLAIVAENFDELNTKLQSYLTFCNGQKPSEKHNQLESLGVFCRDLDSLDVVGKDRKNNTALESQAIFWVNGNELKPLNSSTLICRKVPLPGYEFLRTRYWVPDESGEFHADNLEIKSSSSNLTPNDILERVARNEMTEEEARSLLVELIKDEADNSAGLDRIDI